MATSALSCSPGLLLTLFLLAASAASASEETVRVTPTLIECYPATTNDSSANAASLLGAMPSAATPSRFASLRSAGPDRAFARGICFRDAAPHDCLACLSAAAKNLADGCGAANRRARVRTGGCSVSYADTDVSATSYGAFRVRVVSGQLASTSKSDVHKMLAPADAAAAPVPTKSKTIVLDLISSVRMKMKGDPILLAVFIVAGLSLVPLLAFFICVLLFGCC